MADNPSLDIEDYINRLGSNLSTMLKLQLLNGDWSVVEDAAIHVEWLRYYEMTGEMICAQDVNGKPIASFDSRDCQRFATIDTAGTSEQKAKERKGNTNGLTTRLFTTWQTRGSACSATSKPFTIQSVYTRRSAT